jgi:phosphoribosylanthranilate isomerase
VDQAVPKIKFCGLTNPSDAERAVNAGAWAVGMIMWRSSPRFCRLEMATEIAAAFRRQAEMVGVFVNARLPEIARVADAASLSMVQLHGDEGPAFCAEVARRTGCRVIKAARIRSGADIQALSSFHTDFHLLDSYVAGVPGGTGETFAWELARAHGRKVPVILSGGLTPDNVSDAIVAVRPYAVDVASGVESAPGRKDPDKLEAFAAAVSSSVASTPATSPAPIDPPSAPVSAR